jgi:hypothetical protein
MNNIVTFPSSVNPDDTLEEHAAEIRKGLQDIRRAMSNALDIARGRTALKHCQGSGARWQVGQMAAR